MNRRKANECFAVHDVGFIHLTQGRVAAVDARLLPALQVWPWHFTHGYARSSQKYGRAYLHRVVWTMAEGVVAKEIDHINGDELDCRRANLRVATRSDNMMNRRLQSNNSSGFRGVTRVCDDKWLAWTKRHGKQHHVGYFPTALQAANARDAANMGDEFARFNFPR